MFVSDWSLWCAGPETPSVFSQTSQNPAGIAKMLFAFLCNSSLDMTYMADPPSLSVSTPQLKPSSSASVGWEGSVCSCFPTPEHAVVPARAVLPAAPAAVLSLAMPGHLKPVVCLSIPRFF